ncbi:kinase-like domain-containing protein [Leptodontidium sp. 2 PMI_412]|nr:kinase-like domain-containing protein [Leptodontidium sp. 2 PMI_412]
MSDEIHFPTGFSFKDIVAWGNSGMISLDHSTQTARIYERLQERGGYPAILKYHGSFERGFRLQFASGGDLRSHLKSTHPGNTEQKLRWCKQITTALQFLHSNHVIHGDLRCSNVLLDAELNAKLADFGGSSLDGSPLLVGVTANHECPGSTLSIEGDIFALGSTFYEMMTGQSPYATLPDEEIATSYAQSQFPDVSFMGPIGHVILNCWLGRYYVAEAVDASMLFSVHSRFLSITMFYSLQHPSLSQ